MISGLGQLHPSRAWASLSFFCVSSIICAMPASKPKRAHDFKASNLKHNPTSGCQANHFCRQVLSAFEEIIGRADSQHHHTKSTPSKGQPGTPTSIGFADSESPAWRNPADFYRGGGQQVPIMAQHLYQGSLQGKIDWSCHHMSQIHVPTLLLPAPSPWTPRYWGSTHPTRGAGLGAKESSHSWFQWCRSHATEACKHQSVANSTLPKSMWMKEKYNDQNWDLHIYVVYVFVHVYVYVYGYWYAYVTTYIRRVIPQYPRTIHRTTPRMSPDLKPRPGTLAAAKELSFQAKTPASPWLMSFVFIAFAIAICWKKLKPGSHNSIKIGKHIPHGEQSPKMSVPKGLSCPSTVAGLVVHSLRSNISSGLRTAIILQYGNTHQYTVLWLNQMRTGCWLLHQMLFAIPKWHPQLWRSLAKSVSPASFILLRRGLRPSGTWGRRSWGTVTPGQNNIGHWTKHHLVWHTSEKSWKFSTQGSSKTCSN